MTDKADSTNDESWWVRNAQGIKVLFRVLLGVLWLAAGIFKFVPGVVDAFPGMVQDSAQAAPSWLSGWYSFWVSASSANPALIVYTVGSLEILLGLALILGFARKIAYFGGIALSLLIWAVPEGFGGPYGAGTGATDLGTGLVYAVAFVGLIALNAAFGPSRWSVDAAIEKRFPGWAKIAELNYRKRGRASPAAESGGVPA